MAQAVFLVIFGKHYLLYHFEGELHMFNFTHFYEKLDYFLENRR